MSEDSSQMRKARLMLINLEEVILDALGEDVWANKPDEWWPDALIDPLKQWWCEQVGHDPIPDNCGMPEHEYCIMCGAPTPGEWTRLQSR